MKKCLHEHRGDIIVWIVTVICVSIFVDKFGWIIKNAFLAFFILALIISLSILDFFHDVLLSSLDKRYPHIYRDDHKFPLKHKQISRIFGRVEVIEKEW